MPTKPTNSLPNEDERLLLDLGLLRWVGKNGLKDGTGILRLLPALVIAEQQVRDAQDGELDPMEEDGQRVQDAGHHEKDGCSEECVEVQCRRWQSPVRRKQADARQQIGRLVGKSHVGMLVVNRGRGAVGRAGAFLQSEADSPTVSPYRYLTQHLRCSFSARSTRTALRSLRSTYGFPMMVIPPKP